MLRVKVVRILPLKNMEFTTILKGPELKDIKHKVAKLGGTVVSQCTGSVAAVFAFEGIVKLLINLIFCDCFKIVQSM